MSIITTFIERWQPETNSFHMPFGEMTITLHDVEHILGIRSSGRPVCVLGPLDPAIGELIVDGIDWNNLKLDYLWKLCKNPELMTPQCRASCYLAYLLGCTLFVEKSCDGIPPTYIVLMNDIIEVSGFAWG
ncbi:hypothetical protein LIER_24527 [Lithospermum erythrorhizon]|uniref:Aminotransferase-like plant mobile domain-containing protein n=1 Tax=Lithospermum erythrorhizon TaxID=34254 RepID=A0AAV3R1L8_LITER